MIHALWFAEISNILFVPFVFPAHPLVRCTIEISLNGVIANEKMTCNYTLITARKLRFRYNTQERKYKWKNELRKSRLCISMTGNIELPRYIQRSKIHQTQNISSQRKMINKKIAIVWNRITADMNLSKCIISFLSPFFSVTKFYVYLWIRQWI